jgi:hypothetical protein
MTTPTPQNEAPTSAIRELDRRYNDGLDVRLLWNVRTNRVCVSVIDERDGDSLRFEVDAVDALEAFHHPYAYAHATHKLAA